MVRAMRGGLEVEQADGVARLPHRGRDELQPERLEAQEDLVVHEPARVDAQDLHDGTGHGCGLRRRRGAHIATSELPRASRSAAS